MNYDEAVAGVARAQPLRASAELQAAQVQATLAVADELRTLTEVLVQVVGFTGTPGRAFIRVFDEAP